MNSDRTTEHTGPGAHCPEPPRLAALLSPVAPDDAEAAAVAAHLEHCDVCRRRLDALAGGADLLEGLSADERPPGAGGMAPALSAAMAELRQAAPAAAPHQCDQAPDDEAPEFLEPGAPPGYLGKFGPYHVIAVVGRGGMGIVLKAHDPSLDRVVAIKVLSPALAASPNARRRFTREARAAAAVSHEHVVTIHAVDEAGAGAARLPYLVMQFVGGRSLEARLRATGPLRVEEILRIGMQAASGLAAAHAQGLVHRDVKPANIMLENGVERVKLTDFGLARAADDAAITLTGQVTGTPHYMSPEQARGERVDQRSDLFSLGSVLYAMCTGRPPFSGSSPLTILRKVCDEEPVPVRELNEDAPPWLAETVASLMCKDPAARPQSAAAVAEQLGRHLAHLQHPGKRPAADDTARRLLRQRLGSPHVLTLVAAAVVVLGVVAIRPAARLLGRQIDKSTRGGPAAQPVAPPAAPRAVFTVTGVTGDGARPFASLADAAGAAQPGATIEIDYDGQVETGPVDLGCKPLRIRAAKGKRPILVQSPTFAPVLTTSGPLVLEGVELQGRRGRPDVLPVGDESGECLVAVTGAPLYVSHCRFVVAGALRMRAGCIRLVDCAACEVRDTEMHSQFGMALQWMGLPEGGATLTLENVVIASRMVVVVQKAAEKRAALRLRKSTVYCGGLVVAHPAYQPTGLSVELEDDVLVAGAVLFDPEAERMAGRFADVALTYRQTVLDRLISREFDAAAARPAAAMVERSPTSRPPSTQRGQAAAPGHVEARVRFAGDVRGKTSRGEPPTVNEFALHSARVAGRGNLPTRRLAAVGARTGTVGTGPAYDAFRDSPPYREWQRKASIQPEERESAKSRPSEPPKTTGDGVRVGPAATGP